MTTRIAQTIAQDANVEITGMPDLPQRARTRSERSAHDGAEDLLRHHRLVILFILITHPSLFFWILSKLHRRWRRTEAAAVSVVVEAADLAASVVVRPAAEAPAEAGRKEFMSINTTQQHLLGDLLAQLKHALGDNLDSLVLYGSAAAKDNGFHAEVL